MPTSNPPQVPPQFPRNEAADPARGNRPEHASPVPATITDEPEARPAPLASPDAKRTRQGLDQPLP